MSKVIITGGDGKLAQALKEVFKNSAIPVSKGELDITSVNSVCSFIKDLKPDAIINTAAFISIEGCEEQPEKAFEVNAIGVRNLAYACDMVGSILVQISTDAVFGGYLKEYFTEDDRPHPVNTYGITKLAGEYYASYCKKYYIIRTSLLFGESKKKQFTEKMIEMSEKGRLYVPQDVVISPSYTIDVAEGIKYILSQNLPFGIYHVVNNGKVSLFEFTLKLFSLLDIACEVIPCSQDMFDKKAKKNRYTPLRSVKISPMRSWEDALEEYCRRITG